MSELEFDAWFCDNYPPDCIISRPAWHAPKIYRAATYGLAKERAEMIGLLREAQTHLRHTRCKDEDAMKCPACGIEANIDALLSKVKV